MGPVVEALWRDEGYDIPPPAPAELDEAAMNTVGYVVSRYGALTGRDLEVMSHGERPWILANANRRPGDRAPIRPEWMIEYFRDDAADDDGDEPPLDSDVVTARLRETAGIGAPSTPDEPADSLDALRSWARRDG
jgi:hypothetical protein